MDYSKLGFKCGLEIHQQLKTRKLFCACPAELRNDEPDKIVERELRPMAGETGQIDVAALYEGRKKMRYLYEVYNNSTCLVELDEAPPLVINDDTLEIGLLIAKMLNCEIPDVLEVMRKTVLNGSNTSGFQRTVLIGVNGYVNAPSGKVSIQTVCLEEDSARRTAESPGTVTYRLDRLGIPLIEIATGPDIKTPEQAKEVAKIIGDLLRSTGKVMRGIGTIRQDLNVSITGGTRVEIKGVQNLENVPEIVKEEIKRQKWLIDGGKRVAPEVRNVLPDNKTKFLRPMPGAARMYPETDHPFVTIPRTRINKIKFPESLDAKGSRYTKMGLSPDLVKQMVSSELSGVFDELVRKYKKVKPQIIATTILSTAKDVKRKLNQEESVFLPEHFDSIFSSLNSDQISKDAILDVMLEVAKGSQLKKTLTRFKKLSRQELTAKVASLKKKYSSLPQGALIGKAMSELRGRADGKEIMQLLKT